MRYAAFFRNLNLGRRNCPDRGQFEAAFLDSGAATARSFLANGTIAFDAGSGQDAMGILGRASDLLAARFGMVEPAFLRDMAHLAWLAGTAPFDAIEAASVHGCFVTFVHRDARPGRLPAGSRRGDVEVVGITALEVLCTARQVGQGIGNPNAFVEKSLGAPATTRAWNTLLRLVDRHGG